MRKRRYVYGNTIRLNDDVPENAAEKSETVEADGTVNPLAAEGEQSDATPPVQGEEEENANA